MLPGMKNGKFCEASMSKLGSLHAKCVSSKKINANLVIVGNRITMMQIYFECYLFSPLVASGSLQ